MTFSRNFRLFTAAVFALATFFLWVTPDPELESEGGSPKVGAVLAVLFFVACLRLLKVLSDYVNGRR